MADVMGDSKEKNQEDDVFPVSEMVARVIKALQLGDEEENAPDNRRHELFAASQKEGRNEQYKS
ncbi:MAG: hypothetical protein P8010_22530 [Desulfosarcinaceae bacterium]